jgi:AcrR family transcriptional regulator
MRTPASPPVAPGRRERRRLEVHGRLLAAAERLFDAQGVAATTVGEICARADVVEKTFFNHFGSKQDLLRELAQRALGALLGHIEEARKASGSTRERLEAFFGRIAGELEQAGPMHRELVTEIIHVAHEARIGSEQARVLHAAFRALVADGVAAGEVARGHDVATCTEMLLGAFYALIFDWAHLEGYPVRRRALAAARFLGDAFAGPAAASRPPRGIASARARRSRRP